MSGASKHPWLQRLDITALCPKCGAAALRRSHAKSKFEQYVRAHSKQRLFRCHACGWRGWLDEARIRYPAVTSPEATVPVDERQEIIPDISLEELKAPPAFKPGKSASAMNDNRPNDEVESPFMVANTAEAHSEEHPLGSAFAESEPLPFSRGENSNSSDRTQRPGKKCPSCGELKLFRSRHRGFYESMRKQLSGKRPFRCHKCGWRGWLPKQI